MTDKKRCFHCWPMDSPPPHMWSRSLAPTIPSRKIDLIDQIKPYVKENLELTPLTVPELRQLFRKVVRGEKHPCDPTQGLSCLKKGELQQLCHRHGLPGQGNKGELSLSIRQHWQEQCSIALSKTCDDGVEEDGFEKVVESDSESIWSAVDGGTSSSSTSTALSKAVSKVHQAVAELIDVVSGKNDTANGEVWRPRKCGQKVTDSSCMG